MGELLSLRQYAQRRKDAGRQGGTHVAVSKAIKTGRLVRAVRATPTGRVRIDPAIADREWDDRTDPSQQRDEDPPASAAPPAAASEQPGKPARLQTGALIPDAFPPKEAPRTGLNLSDQRAALVAFNARMAQLEFEQRSGNLVPKRDVEREAMRLGRKLRDALLALPNRLAPELAAETDPHTVRERLLRELHSILENLGHDDHAKPPMPAPPAPHEHGG